MDFLHLGFNALQNDLDQWSHKRVKCLRQEKYRFVTLCGN